MIAIRRLSQQVFANWRQERPCTNDLPTDVKDNVFVWQLGGADFNRIDGDTLLRAELATNKGNARRILQGAQAAGVIDPSTGKPRTDKIDRNFVNALPVMSHAKHRELVMLLFFWEEEITRWRLLSEEEAEIQQNLQEEDTSDPSTGWLGDALRIVRAKKRIVPSRRDESGHMQADENEELPSYVERSG